MWVLAGDRAILVNRGQLEAYGPNPTEWLRNANYPVIENMRTNALQYVMHPVLFYFVCTIKGDEVW